MKRHTSSHMWLLLVLTAFVLTANLIACGCGDDDDDNNDSDANDNVDDDADDDADDDVDDDDDYVGEPFRIAVISEPLILVDDLWGHNDQLALAVDKINSEMPDIEFVIIMGDFAAYWITDWRGAARGGEKAGEWDEMFGMFMYDIESLTPPFYATMGEMDYSDEVQAWPRDITYVDDWGARDQVFKDSFGDAYPGANPWYTVEKNGVTFFMANTMAGDDFDQYAGNIGSLGDAQMTALQQEMDSGNPMIFVGHHSPRLTFEGEGNDTVFNTMTSKSGGVFSVFDSQLRQYRDYDLGGINAHSFGSVSNGGNNVAYIEIVPNDRTVTILNRDDLLYYEGPQENTCTPGVDTVGNLDDFVGTYQGVFVPEWSTDFFIFDLLAHGEDAPDFPFLFHILDQQDDMLDVMMTYGVLASFMDGAGDHAVASHAPAPCSVFQYRFDDPCIYVDNPESNFDALLAFNSGGAAQVDCGLEMKILIDDYTFDGQLVRDDEGVHIDWIYGAGQLLTNRITEAFERFIIDAYCAYDCVTDLMPQDGCDTVANGHQAACDAGTLGIDDIPTQCDLNFGYTSTSARFLLGLIGLLSDTEVHGEWAGWGHQMVPQNEGDFWNEGWMTDWALDLGSFDSDEALCPDWP
jgi:hypothetical protein